MRTGGVKKLVNEVIGSLSQPFTEDVIDDAFHAIESNAVWRRKYDDLCGQLGKTVVNTWGGYWIANAVGKSGLRQVPSAKSSLIQSYSKLDAPALAKGGKRKKLEALTMMADYYQAHKGELPSHMERYRGLIVELLMEGMSPEQAFAMVLADDA